MNKVAEITIAYVRKEKVKEKVQVKTSAQAYAVLKEAFPSLEHREYFYILLVNRANYVLGTSQISMGGLAGTVVDVRIIFQTALKANASGIILAHNHPSGNLQPSDEDIRLTKKLKEGGKLLDFSVLDHIILTEDGYLSFQDDGLM